MRSKQQKQCLQDKTGCKACALVLKIPHLHARNHIDPTFTPPDPCIQSLSLLHHNAWGHGVSERIHKAPFGTVHYHA